MLEGKRVLLMADLPWAEELAAALRNEGATLYAVEDANPEDGFDCLILAPGVMRRSFVFETTPEDFDLMAEQNYQIPWQIAHRFAPHMKAGGTIVLIGSDYAVGGVIATAAYAASMGALRDLCRALNLRYPALRCNLVLAGVALSAANEPTRAYYGDRAAEFLPLHIALTPHEGESRDIIEAALFLASEQSGAMRGEGLPVDGGIKTLAHTHARIGRAR